MNPVGAGSRIARTMTSLRVAVAGAAALLALAATGGAGAQGQTLSGVVGPGFSIKLTDSTGAPVVHLDPGTYTIQVQDLADIHNFHLTGPGVDQTTEVEGMGTFTWTVTFTDGTYHFQCDPHSTTMFGNFTVGNAPAPKPPAPKPPAPKPPVAKPVQLAGSVGPGKRIALTRAGAAIRVVSLKRGAAVVRVSDRSATDNFHLIGPGVNRATTRAGKATVTWRLALKPGLYTYRSDATPSLRGSLRVR
jgi:plastocyanin